MTHMYRLLSEDHIQDAIRAFRLLHPFIKIGRIEILYDPPSQCVTIMFMEWKGA